MDGNKERYFFKKKKNIKYIIKKQELNNNPQ